MNEPTTPDPTPSPDAEVEVPAAARLTRPGWREPRFLLGLLLITASILIGARLWGGPSQGVEVWAARHDLADGIVITREELQPRRIVLPDGGPGSYWPVSEPPPPRFRLAAPLRTGDLVPRWAVADEAAGSDQVEVPLTVAMADVPPGVRPGVRVQVWALPGPGEALPEEVAPVFSDAAVIAVTQAESLDATGTLRLVVVVPGDAGLGAALARLASGRVLVTMTRLGASS